MRRLKLWVVSTIGVALIVIFGWVTDVLTYLRRRQQMRHQK